jgi:hypothetical protein
VKVGDEMKVVLDILDGDGHQTAQWALSGATRLVDEWEGVALRALFAGESWAKDGGDVQVIEKSPAEWSYVLNAVAAEAAAQDGVRLGEPGGLDIHDGERQGDDQLIVAVRARFLPLDGHATRVFALHEAIRAVVEQDAADASDQTIEAATSAAREAYRLEPDALRESEVVRRLWTDRHYRHVYALRAAKDFPYD